MTGAERQLQRTGRVYVAQKKDNDTKVNMN